MTPFLHSDLKILNFVAQVELASAADGRAFRALADEAERQIRGERAAVDADTQQRLLRRAKRQDGFCQCQERNRCPAGPPGPFTSSL